MRTITLRQALALKNRITGELSQLETKLAKHNSYKEEETVKPVNTTGTLQDLEEIKNNLVELKAEIAKANVPVVKTIYLLSELKSLIVALKDLNTREGTFTESLGFGSSAVKTSKYVCFIDENTKEEFIKAYQEKIIELQDTLDHFNHTTYVTINF